MKKEEGRWYILLIQHQAGHWSFPKGRVDCDETPRQTAARELKEETGLTIVDYLVESPFTESYDFFARGQKIYKTVSYFLARVEGDPHPQLSEIKTCQWFLLSEAIDQLTFAESKRILCQIKPFLQDRE